MPEAAGVLSRPRENTLLFPLLLCEERGDLVDR